jgi:hypothetical protein
VFANGRNPMVTVSQMSNCDQLLTTDLFHTYGVVTPLHRLLSLQLIADDPAVLGEE